MTAQTTDPAALPPEGRALAQLLAGSQIRIAQARLAAERKGNTARAEAIAAYGRAAELAVSMGYPERVSPLERLAALSRTEIEHMTDALYKGLDVAAAQKLAVSATA